MFGNGKYLYKPQSPKKPETNPYLMPGHGPIPVKPRVSFFSKEKPISSEPESSSPRSINSGIVPPKNTPTNS